MPKTISRALEERLLRSRSFLEHLKDLHHMTGLEVLYVGSLGKERLRAPREPTTVLRRLDHQIPFLAESRIADRQTALVGGEPRLPWREVIHPIRIEEETVGYLVLSAWRPSPITIAPLRTLWVQWAREGLDVRWKDLEAAWESLPAATEDQISAWQRHLRMVADDSIRQLEHPTEPHLIPDQLPALIQKACGLVQTSFRDAITLEATARACGVSPEHLSRTFHQTTGLRFREYVAETRIQEICTELRETSDPIGDIAQRNGFSTLSRFNRAFRDSMGMTPREWRKRQFRQAVSA